jgi:DNA sulfur modification protein DndD
VLIKQIKISNFRSYYNDVIIGFDSRGDKNITLISGKNGFGKTSFLTSLIWGFYGKLMSKVEDKYRIEIKGYGGYENFLLQQFNRNQKSKSTLKVEIILTDILIPSIPCEEVKIKRTFDVNSKKESLEILIDGDHNELTKKVGYETFINDFILPREIAKFFFFDSEKIVSLAEAKTKEELKSLSKAYSEVLGLKKYEDLKNGLNSLISTLKRRGVNSDDSDKLSELIDEKNELEKEIEFIDETLRDTSNDIENFRIKSDSLQEKLIREGNVITIDEFKQIKTEYQKLLENSKRVRKDLNENLEFIPFVISINLFEKVIDQIKLEIKGRESSIDTSTKIKITSILENTLNDIESSRRNKYIKEFQKEISSISKSNNKVLFDFSDETNRKILSIHDNIKNTFLEKYKLLVNEEKDNRFLMSKKLRKIQSFESKKSSPLNLKYREEKEVIDNQLEKSLVKSGELSHSKTQLSNQLANVNKRISEIENRQKIIGDDKRKLELSRKVLQRLKTITDRIKIEKKYSLEKSILLGLNSLMHKSNFIEKVNIEIHQDYLEIHLIDDNGQTIDKESMSKGEQQLYATSILKSLVEESGISFPVFVDSPLQKFDKEHSKNIIQKFYPKISKQVVLFPLVEKELTFDEFKLMERNISSIHKIINKDGNSNIQKVETQKEFFS